MDPAQRPHTRLLLCSRQNDSLLAMQREVFRGSGYQVLAASSDDGLEEQIENSDFDVLVLNHTLSFSQRKALARKTKQRNPNHGVLVLHHSGSLGNPYVDLAVDSRTGVSPTLQAIKRVEAMLHARTQHVGDSKGKYIVVADLNRNYTFVSDPVCDLLGYDRANFLELRIDDVVDGSTQLAAPLFQEFVAKGKQTGRITLRHRSGKKIPVQYSSSVEPDGCAVAEWRPLDGSATI